jgi:hypothetical protein
MITVQDRRRMMDIQQLGRQTLDTCRKNGWAALETGISRPVPEVKEGQVRPPHQMLYEPFARLAVDYATGQIVERQVLPTSTPPQVLGRYPHAAAAKLPPDQWQATWDELFKLYPEITAANAAGRLGAPSASGAGAPNAGRLVLAFFHSASDYLRIYDCGDRQYHLDWPMGKRKIARDVALALARNELLFFNPPIGSLEGVYRWNDRLLGGCRIEYDSAFLSEVFKLPGIRRKWTL